MTGKLIELDDYRPHGVYRDRCNVCGHVCVSVVPIGADLTTLECSLCGACDSTAEPISDEDDPSPGAPA